MAVSWIELGAAGAGAGSAGAGAGAGRAGGAVERARVVIARAHQADRADQRCAVRTARLCAGVAGRGEGRVHGIDGVATELLGVADSGDGLRIRSGLLVDRGGLANRHSLDDEMACRAAGRVELGENGVTDPHLE